MAGIKEGRWKFYTSVNGRSVWVIIAIYNGREYLKTEADGCIHSADALDAFVRVVMLSLINAGNLNVVGPLSFPPWNIHRATFST
jgi:hypothetical protein